MQNPFPPEQDQRSEIVAQPLSHNLSGAFGHPQASPAELISRMEQQNRILQAMLSAINDFVYVLDREGCLVYANQPLLDLWQRNLQDVIGKNLFDLSYPDELAARLHQQIQHVIDTGQSLKDETPYTSPTGVKSFYEYTLRPVLSPEGALELVAGSMREIIDHKHIEKKLIAEKTISDSIINSMPGVVYFIDQTRHYLRWNRNVEVVTGYSSAELAEIDVIDLIPEDQRELVQSAMNKVFVTGKAAIEADFLAKDGTRIPYYFTGRRIEIEDKPYLIGMGIDISRQRRALADSARSERLYRAIATNFPNGSIYLLDAERRFSLAEGRGMASVGLSREAVVGKTLEEVFSGTPFYQTLSTAYQKALEGEETASEVEIQGRWRSLRVLSVHDDEGALSFVMAITQDITDRKRVETEQDARTREVLAIWESMTDAFFAVDMQWRFTYVNSQAALLLQKNREELVGKSVWEEFPEAVSSTFEREYKRAVQEQVKVDFEEFYPPLNTWFEVHAYPSSAGLAVYFRDVTERKQMMEALRTSEERFAILSRATNDAVYDWNILTGDLWWNENIEVLFGYRKDEFTPTIDYWESKIHPHDRQRVSDSLYAVIDKGAQTWSYEYRFQRADGSYATVFDRGFIIRGAENKPVRMVGSVQDITARKEAEEERDRFFTLSLDMLCIADTNGYFKRVNPAFEAILGYSTEELISNSYLKWVHPDDLEATLAEMENLAQGQRTLSFVNRYRCADGSYKWLSWRCAPFQDSIYAAAHDITTVKQAEVALYKANEQLELHVRERTAELRAANEQLGTVNEALRIENIEHEMTMAALRELAEALQQAKEEADAANRAKSEFLSRMSHELRTPLNAILGFGQLLEMEQTSAEGQEGIEHILKAGQHLLALINEVLDISRVEAGRLELSIEPIALDETIAECCSLVRPLAAERHIHLVEEIDEWRGTYVLADLQRLKQVLLNLLSNAIKYNRLRGQVNVSCSSCITESGSSIRIEVRDTGPGIAPEHLSKLFTPFERLEATGSQVEGTGLGLALSKRLVEAMGGTLQVHSEPGQGSVFSVELPLAAEGHVPGDESFLSGEQADGQELVENAYSILCIEDNLSNLRLIERILNRRPGITLLAAMQGSLGLDLARQHRPDLILLDLNLPDTHGREVLARLQQDELTREIPVVVISADATQPQIERLLRAGAKAYLTKPLDVKQFLRTIDEVLHP